MSIKLENILYAVNKVFLDQNTFKKILLSEAEDSLQEKLSTEGGSVFAWLGSTLLNWSIGFFAKFINDNPTIKEYLRTQNLNERETNVLIFQMAINQAATYQDLFDIFLSLCQEGHSNVSSIAQWNSFNIIFIRNFMIASYLEVSEVYERGELESILKSHDIKKKLELMAKDIYYTIVSELSKGVKILRLEDLKNFVYYSNLEEFNKLASDSNFYADIIMIYSTRRDFKDIVLKSAKVAKESHIGLGFLQSINKVTSCFGYEGTDTRVKNVERIIGKLESNLINPINAMIQLFEQGHGDSKPSDTWDSYDVRFGMALFENLFQLDKLSRLSPKTDKARLSFKKLVPKIHKSFLQKVSIVANEYYYEQRSFLYKQQGVLVNHQNYYYSNSTQNNTYVAPPPSYQHVAASSSSSINVMEEYSPQYNTNSNMNVPPPNQIHPPNMFMEQQQPLEDLSIPQDLLRKKQEALAKYGHDFN
ncbi:hypothetical protein L3V86_08755 [Thiotrichales bacterium 19S11-10]|nr:hypothetical protein [Thiotrichales bacterium 19S11-10]